MPRNFIAICSLFLTIFALAACAPAALTSTPLESNLTSPYFDSVIRWENPYNYNSLARVERFIERKLIRDMTDNSQFIRDKMQEGGGTCSSQGQNVTCTMHRRLVSVGCFRDVCDKTLKQWVLTISWRETGGAVVPHVKINMTLDKIS